MSYVRSIYVLCPGGNFCTADYSLCQMLSQPALTCSKSTMETQEQCVKYAQN